MELVSFRNRVGHNLKAIPQGKAPKYMDVEILTNNEGTYRNTNSQA